MRPNLRHAFTLYLFLYEASLLTQAWTTATIQSFLPSSQNVDGPLHCRRFSRVVLQMDKQQHQHQQQEEYDHYHSRSNNIHNEELLQRNITAIVDKKIRVAKAKSEIDRILQGPEAPFDIEKELERVKSIAPPVEETIEEQELDGRVSQLEQDLYQAVKLQDYSQAAQLKKEISDLHIDDCGAILQVNAAFYRAFREKNIQSMESLWLKDSTATCIHPSIEPLVGSKAVLESWKRMFETAERTYQQTWMEPRNIRLSVKGASSAILICEELVYARRFVRGKKRQSELINKLIATNIFRKVGGRWYLTHHHASWHADSDAAKQALKASRSLSNTKSVGRRRLISEDDDDDDEDNASIGMDGILGVSNYGPLIGSQGENDETRKPEKRIVMGSLSDILNSNLGDILSTSGTTGDLNEGSAIISFSRIEDEDDEDEDDDLEMLGEDDEEYDEDTDSEAVSIIKQWAESSETRPERTANGKSTKAAESAPKDVLRQSCITALRKLCDQGSISAKQKQMLLTDIITCSAKGEFSLVEVAYELLCGEGDDKDVAYEEFADQCRVLANSMKNKE